MNIMKKITTLSVLAITTITLMAAVSFSKREAKRNSCIIQNVSNSDSLFFIPYKVRKVDIIDFLKRETLFEITYKLHCIAGEDAAIVDSIVVKTMGKEPLKYTKSWNLKDIESLNYSPDYFVEGYIKKEDELCSRYTLYIDSKAKKSHITLQKDEKVYSSQLFQQKDSVYIDRIIELLDRNLAKSEIKQSESVDKEEPFPPTSIKDNPMYFKEETSALIADAISNWTLSKILLIDPMKNEGDLLHGYSIVSSCDRISSKNSKSLRDLLLDSKSYRQSDVVKNATFLPDYACQFTKDGDFIDVLVALYCDDIKVFYKNKEYTLDITPSHRDFASFIKEIFPNDKYIKKY